MKNWEDGIYEPEEQGHDWRWACEQMVALRRVRRKMWDWGYIPYDDTNGMILHRHDFDATDWILYSEPEVPHDWAWACEQLLAGKKVRRKLWIGHWYQFKIGLKPNGCYRELYEPWPGPICEVLHAICGRRATVSEADFKATDWVLADEGVKP
jgi:hypothetical protein